MFGLLPTRVCVPVVANVAVSPFTNPLISPSAVSAVPSYTFCLSGVVTVSVAGVISTTAEVCSTYVLSPTLTVPLTYTGYSPTSLNIGSSAV